MSNRTWACVACGKSYRRKQSIKSVICAICRQPCEYVHWKIHIPSPKKRKEWQKFWTQYIAEKKQLEDYFANGRKGELRLEILSMHYHGSLSLAPAKNPPAPNPSRTDGLRKRPSEEKLK